MKKLVERLILLALDLANISLLLWIFHTKISQAVVLDYPR